MLIAVIISTLIYNFGLKEINFSPYELDWSGFKLKSWNYQQDDLVNKTYWKYGKEYDSYGDKIMELAFGNINLNVKTTFVALGTSIPLAILFFLDQGFCSIVTNSHKNCLEKPGGFHADLFLVGVINIILSIFGLPWCHLALPHSDWHVAAVSETRIEEIDGQSTVFEKV